MPPHSWLTSNCAAPRPLTAASTVISGRCGESRSNKAAVSPHFRPTAYRRQRRSIGTRPTRIGIRLHGMASREEEIELNRGRSRKNLVGGTDGSNLVPSSEESGANLAFGGASHR